MITTLTGENWFAVRSDLEAITSKFLEEYGEMGLERIDGDESDFGRISEALTSLPFLASKKLIVFKNPSSSKDFTEKFENLLAGLPETTDLVLVETKLDKRTALYKYLKKSSDFIDRNRLSGHDLAKWLVDQTSSRNGKLSIADANFLVDRVGDDQQLLASDLDKLLIHSANISRADIELLVDKTPQSKIFDMLDAVFGGNIKKAMVIYEEQLAMQVAPQEIIGLLGWQLKILAIVATSGERSAADVAREFGMSPYAIQKSWRIGREAGLVKIKQYIRDLLDLDVRLKSQTLDAGAALGQYLLDIAKENS